MLWNRALTLVAIMDKPSACSESANVRYIAPLAIRIENRAKTQAGSQMYAVRPTQGRVTTLTLR